MKGHCHELMGEMMFYHAVPQIIVDNAIMDIQNAMDHDCSSDIAIYRVSSAITEIAGVYRLTEEEKYENKDMR